MVVERKYLRGTISTLLQILLKKKESQVISETETDDVEKQINTETSKSQSA